MKEKSCIKYRKVEPPEEKFDDPHISVAIVHEDAPALNVDGFEAMETEIFNKFEVKEQDVMKVDSTGPVESNTRECDVEDDKEEYDAVINETSVSNKRRKCNLENVTNQQQECTKNLCLANDKNFFLQLYYILDTYSNHNGPHNRFSSFYIDCVNSSQCMETLYSQEYCRLFSPTSIFNYDHDRDGTNTQLAGCEVRFHNYNFDTRISIGCKNNILSGNRGEWKNCFVVNNVELSTGYFFGQSATTDDLSDNHDIFSFKFYDLDSNVTPEIIMARANIIPNAKTFEPPQEHKDDPKSSMSNAKIFFILLFGLLIAIVLSSYGACCDVLLFTEKWLKSYGNDNENLCPGCRILENGRKCCTLLLQK
uniref:L-type lectin-like domain-containing protein n=1 Tax=Glossina palpalis gambiensis TaxID=67801 RepID=A0A1B0BP19_9MUSC